MGALPKNKITRAERGKRRAGNTPDLKKDPNVTAVPLYKRGLVNSILAATGLKAISKTADTKSKADHKDTSKKHTKTAPSISPAMTAAQETAKLHPAAQTKPTSGRKTQHKG